MLMVEASVRASDINGWGLFADKKIPKGTIVWSFDSDMDILFDPENIELMEKNKKEFIKKYAFLSSRLNKYVFSLDDSRYMNHSSTNPNIDSISIPESLENIGIAIKDIEVGEEILVNYKLFDEADKTSPEEYLKN